MFIANPSTPEDEVERLSENFQQIIISQGGRIIKTENMGRRSLAYRIDRYTEGLYTLFEIEGTGREIAELERRMRVSDQIIRYLTVRIDEDRQRAEKFRARRAQKASKRPFAGNAAQRSSSSSGGGSGGGSGGAATPTATAATSSQEDES